ncbi:MAG: homocysteine S-methyltransferase family protein [Salaquimonas sp.]
MTRNIVLLDGGMGQELIHRSKKPPSPMWSAQVMMDEPEIVSQVHAEYIDAGAKVITLNSYSATPERLARDSVSALFKPLQAKAIEVAQAARGGKDVKIAGCLPPMVASYKPELVPDLETCLASYRAITAEQQEHVDLFLCETLSTIVEVKAAVTAGVESGKPVWCGMTVVDGEGTKLRSGESLADATMAAKNAGASAVLINCSWPEAVTQGMAILKEYGLPFGGYANGFTSIDALDAGGTVAGLKVRKDLDPAAYTAHAIKWIEAGATIVGGCCEVGPTHIKHLNETLIEQGYCVGGELNV